MALEVGELYAKLTIESKVFDREMDDARDKMNDLGKQSDKTFGGMKKMALLASAGIAGVGASVASMGPALAGVAGLSASFASAGIGAVAYGAVATSVLGQVFEKTEEIAKLEEKLASADSAKERIQAQKELAEAMAGVSDAQKFAMTELNNFKSFWGDFTKQFEEPIFNTFGTSLHFMQELLNGLAPTISNVSDVLLSFMEGLDQDISNGGFAKFFEWMEVNGAESLRSFLETASNTMGGFFNLMYAFAPIGASMEEGLMNLTQKFEDWSASLEGSPGFQKFIEYAKENGPVFMSTIGNIANAIGDLIVVLAPLGSAVLKGLEQGTAGLEQFTQFIRDNMGSIGGIIRGIGDFFMGLVSKIDNVSGTIDQLKTMWVEGFKTVSTVVTPLIQLIGDKFMEIVGGIIDWWNTNGSQLLDNFMIVFQGIWGVIQFIMPAILAVVSMIFDNIKGVIMGALNVISGVFKIFAGLFTGDWSKMWDGVKQLVMGALQAVWNLFQLMMMGRLVASIKSFITGGINLFKSFGAKVAQTFDDFINSVINLFGYFRATGTGIWQSIVSTVKNIVQLFVGAVKANFDDLLTGATTKFNAIKDAIMNPIKTAKDKVGQFIDEIKGFFKGLKLELPKIKMPRFSIKNWSKNPVDWIKAMPTLSVDWFKTGGIATGPAIAGVGEAGSEAIVPLSGQRMKPFATEIMNQMVKAGAMQQGQGGGNQTVVILEVDGQRFAKAVARPIKEETERMEITEERGRGKRR